MIRVALIGYGLAGRVFHAPLIATTEGLKLAAIVSHRIGEVTAAYPAAKPVTDPQVVFDDPGIDLVVVATPNDSHFDLAYRALQSGKHVVIDKPFALTAAEAKSLIDQAHGRLLTVFHNRRWDGDYLTLKSLVRSGALGTVAFVESRFDHFRPTVQDRWRERAGPATGIWYDLGSHLLDQALDLFGPPLGITADLAARRTGAQTTDYFRTVLRYEAMRVVVAGNSLAPMGTRFAVHGTGGSFIKRGLDPQERMLAAGALPRDGAYGLESEPARLVLAGGGTRDVVLDRGRYDVFYANLRDSLHGIAPLAVPPSQALAVMTLLEAGEESANERREILTTV